MPGFSIAPTTAGDVEELTPFVKASWARTYDPIIGEDARKAISGAKHGLSLFEAEFATPQGIGMVARDAAGTVIGHIGGEVKPDRCCFIDRLHIDPQWKGKGLAAALLDAVVDALSGEVDRIELTVLVGNERAFGFYHKYGFVDVATLGPEHGLGGIGSVLMRFTTENPG